MRRVVLVAAVAALSACTSTPRPPAETPSHGTNANKTRPYEVLGQRYVPLLSAEGYVERGVASWYGPNFDGRPTANGEVFDMHAMTAAHKTLPLPTYAQVTNLRNGRQITVRINDRGPFIDNRLIDLSYAAAQALDMVGPGTTLVEVRALPSVAVASVEPPPPPPEPVAQAETEPPPAFYIQVGAYADDGNALRARERLSAGGFGNVIVERVARAGDFLHRVRVGPVSSVAQFDADMARLVALGFDRARLAVD